MSHKRSLDQLGNEIFKDLGTIQLNYIISQVVTLFLSVKFYSRFVPVYYWLPPSLTMLLLMGIRVISAIYTGAKQYGYLLNERDKAKESDGMANLARSRMWANIYMWFSFGLIVGFTLIIFHMLIQVATGCK